MELPFFRLVHMTVYFFVVLTFITFTSSLQIAAVTQAELGEVRTFKVTASPTIANPNGFSLVGAKATLNGSGGVISANLNIGKFAITNPALVGQSTVGFYFGVLAASANVDTGASTSSISGAFAEVAAGFSQIFVWFDGDGTPGLQYVLGSDVDCTSAGFPATSDCIDPAGKIDLSSLTWSTFSKTNQSCGGGNYQADCQVYSFTTTGSLSGQSIAVFTFKLASEPVLVNNIKIGPDYGKIDVTINYPWTGKTFTRSTPPRVGLLAVAAGKAAVGIASLTKLASGATFSWAGTAGINTFFSWEGTATVNSGQSTVYVAGISGADLDNFKCDSNVKGALYCAAAAIRVGFLQVYAKLYAFTGWDVRLIWFTWADEKPTTVFWDPALGATPQATSGAGFTSVSAYGLIVSVVVAWLLH